VAVTARSGGERRWDEVLAFLEGGGLGERVRRVDTHGAVVLLGGERAWKLKRPVRFSFMDFSTPKRREAVLRTELALNRRTAPELYERVLPVTRGPDGRLALEGGGEPVEWLLRMRRFPADAQLDRMAAAGGGLARELVEELALAIARFHAEAEPRPEAGGAAAMREVAAGNAGDLRGLVPGVFDPEPVLALDRATAAELDRQGDLLERRRHAGKVRRCHGDLHLANIVLLDGRPVLFDCLEFSEGLATIDVLYDLAFLVMDMIERGLRTEAWRLLQAYNDRALEDEGLALLPLFLSVRAAIRAKITGFTVGVREGDEERGGLCRQANAYLDLAGAALAPAPPSLVVVAGLSGTGKSSLAAGVAPRIGAMPGAVVLRSDVIRKRLLGREPGQRLPPEGYAPEVTDRVFATIAERAATLLRAGRTVVCDAVYGLEGQRQAIGRIAARAGVPFRPFWLEAPPGVLEARVAARVGDASDADVAVVRRQHEAIDTGAVAWPRLAADRPLPQLVSELLRSLEA
jgi:aminoglycoside phosphotransferase family enzyme/predicted kinase